LRLAQIERRSKHHVSTPGDALDDTLEDNGINTLLANSLKTKIIAQAKLKDDKIARVDRI
jgi:hypothetical protein